VADAATSAEDWMAGRSQLDGETVEQELVDALNDEDATETDDGNSALKRLRQRREQLAEQLRLKQAQKEAEARLKQAQEEAETMFANAEKHLQQRKAKNAIEDLREYIAHPHATKKANAQELLSQVEVAVSDFDTLEALAAMTDEEFDRVTKQGMINDGRVEHPAIVAIRKETIQRNISPATQVRANLKLARKEQLELQRQVEEQNRRNEESRRLFVHFETREKALDQRKAKELAPLIERWGQLLAEAERLSQELGLARARGDLERGFSLQTQAFQALQASELARKRCEKLAGELQAEYKLLEQEVARAKQAAVVSTISTADGSAEPLSARSDQPSIDAKGERLQRDHQIRRQAVLQRLKNLADQEQHELARLQTSIRTYRACIAELEPYVAQLQSMVTELQVDRSIGQMFGGRTHSGRREYENTVAQKHRAAAKELTDTVSLLQRAEERLKTLRPEYERERNRLLAELATVVPPSAVAPSDATQAKESQQAQADHPGSPGEQRGGSRTSPITRPTDAPPAAIAPFDATQATRHQHAWADYLGEPVEQAIDLGDGVRLTMVLIPPGEFLMGASKQQQAVVLAQTKTQERGEVAKGFPNQLPQHRVQISQPFALSRHEVTRRQFRQFAKETGHKMSAETGFSQTDDDPVVRTSWTDGVAFCEWLSKKEKATYRLPKEAEWEYACRAGTTTFWHCGENDNALRESAWFNGNSGGGTRPVGQLKPNAWGLCDMHGNVNEWCSDWYDDDYYSASPVNDPTGAPTGTHRVYRSGSWSYSAGKCSSPCRGSCSPGGRYKDLGFRIARVLSGT